MASDSTARIISIGCQSAARPCRPSTSRRSVIAKAASLGAPPRISVTAVGEPWYTSGTHMWNGTAPSLNARPDTRNTMPNTSAIFSALPAATLATSARSRWPVAP